MEQITEREFINRAGMGLAFYEKRKTRIEWLTIATNILEKPFFELFENYLKRLSSYDKYKHGYEYLGVLIQEKNRCHIHTYWRKPFYIDMSTMRGIWQKLAGENSNVTNKTVKGDKSSIDEMTKLIIYMAQQGEHHADPETKVNANTIFFKSEYWGIPRPKKEKPIAVPLKMRGKFNREESYIIDGQFVTKEIFENYIKIKNSVNEGVKDA